MRFAKTNFVLIVFSFSFFIYYYNISEPIMSSAYAQDFEDDDFEDFGDEDFSSEDEEDFTDKSFDDDFEGDVDISDFDEAGQEENFDVFSESEEKIVVEEPSDIDGEPLDAQVIDPPSEVPAQVETIPVAEKQEPGYNEDYENQLYNLYKSFYSAPVSSEDWNKVVSQREGEKYNIQPNDSLWAISETFFGDGLYWPKIWSINSRITNPHIIRTGNTIMFKLGDLSNPPEFNISDGSSPRGSEVLEAGVFVASSDGVALPPPQQKVIPVLRLIPPSLPRWSSFGAPGEQELIGVTSENIKPVTEIPLTAFIRNRSLPSIAKVIEAEDGEKLAILNQFVYLKFKSEPEQDQYMIVGPRGKVKGSLKEGKLSGQKGYSYEVQGVVEVVGQLEGKSNIYRARIVKSLTPITKDAIVTEREFRTVDISAKGEFSDVEGQIIGGAILPDSVLVMKGMFAYINRGENQSLSEGDRVEVVSQRLLRRERSKLKGPIFKKGEAVVVDVDSSVATIYITSANTEIFVGDFIGTSLFVKDGSVRVQSDENLDLEGDFDSGDGGDDDDFGDDLEGGEFGNDEGEFGDDEGGLDDISDDEFADSDSESEDSELGDVEDFDDGEFDDEEFEGGSSGGGDDFSEEELDDEFGDEGSSDFDEDF